VRGEFLMPRSVAKGEEEKERASARRGDWGATGGKRRGRWSAAKPHAPREKCLAGVPTRRWREMRSTRVWKTRKTHLQTIRAFGPHLCVRDVTPRAAHPSAPRPVVRSEPARASDDSFLKTPNVDRGVETREV